MLTEPGAAPESGGKSATQPAEASVQTLRGMYMTAEEAAAELDITVPTFYSYVSRKPIRSEGIEGTRKRKYWRPDVEALRRGSTVGEPVQETGSTTSITLVTDLGPFYRGESAIELSRTESAESIAARLWQVSQADLFGKVPPAPPRRYKDFRSSIAHLPAVDRYSILLTMLEADDRRAFDLSLRGFTTTAVNVLRWFAAVLIDAPAPTDEPLHLFIANHLNAPKGLADIIRRLLVLGADHGLAASTAAVRMLASTGVTPYRVAITGLAASSGRRLPFGQLNGISRVLDELITSPHPADAIMARIREGQELPGFGAGIYGGRGDPRAAELLSALAQQFGDHREVKQLIRARDAAAEISNLRPDFGLVTVFVCRMLKMKTEDRVLARLSRLIGWVAHSIEAYEQGPPDRSHEFYSGPLPHADGGPDSSTPKKVRKSSRAVRGAQA